MPAGLRAQQTAELGMEIDIPHSVDLAWQASPTPGCTYRVYRSQVSGSDYVQVADHVSGLAWTDPHVEAGVTYYYVVVAVNAAGTPSPFSNEASAAIPEGN